MQENRERRNEIIEAAMNLDGGQMTDLLKEDIVDRALDTRDAVVGTVRAAHELGLNEENFERALVATKDGYEKYMRVKSQAQGVRDQVRYHVENNESIRLALEEELRKREAKMQAALLE